MTRADLTGQIVQRAVVEVEILTLDQKSLQLDSRPWSNGFSAVPARLSPSPALPRVYRSRPTIDSSHPPDDVQSRFTRSSFECEWVWGGAGVRVGCPRHPLELFCDSVESIRCASYRAASRCGLGTSLRGMLRDKVRLPRIALSALATHEPKPTQIGHLQRRHLPRDLPPLRHQQYHRPTQLQRRHNVTPSRNGSYVVAVHTNAGRWHVSKLESGSGVYGGALTE